MKISEAMREIMNYNDMNAVTTIYHLALGYFGSDEEAMNWFTSSQKSLFRYSPSHLILHNHASDEIDSIGIVLTEIKKKYNK